MMFGSFLLVMMLAACAIAFWLGHVHGRAAGKSEANQRWRRFLVDYHVMAVPNLALVEDAAVEKMLAPKPEGVLES